VIQDTLYRAKSLFGKKLRRTRCFFSKGKRKNESGKVGGRGPEAEEGIKEKEKGREIAKSRRVPEREKVEIVEIGVTLQEKKSQASRAYRVKKKKGG